MDVVFSIFPKFYAHLDVRRLAALVREVGLDTTNVVVRDGYWVSADSLAAELPAFVKAMREEGIAVRFATARFTADRLIADPTPLRVFSDNGIEQFRMEYFRAGEDPRQAFTAARSALERLVPLCERNGVRAVLQVHHGTLITNASAAWHLVDGLPAKSVGIELDPGNQSFEGFERWDRSALLLGEHLVAVGVKDTVLVRDASHAQAPDKGWTRDWAPIYEGVTNWYDLVRALAAIDFSGTLVFMPFYDENDPEAMTKKLRREVAYLRGVLETVGAGAAGG